MARKPSCYKRGLSKGHDKCVVPGCENPARSKKPQSDLGKLCQKHIHRMSRNGDTDARIKQRTKTGNCHHCGAKTTFVYCSPKCRWRDLVGKKFDNNRVCRTCSKKISPLAPTNKIYCSPKCQRRGSNRSKRLSRTPHVSAVASIKGWSCWLCGKKVLSQLKWPHPRSGSVDHVVPYSKGGSDEMDNLKVAHLVCNKRRGNRTP